ncbi:TetR/AcrR family transcriptional regulator [Elioraea sp. Yellowstone]|jgi:AcrR family transcriptional regulator|uniref:TetR/AcrR family transcriptional regulator n=1 Tax=Elioraea sp. Yellowstone TaxID=2592070 RepID=UPI00115283A9|nr:TetR/AcrR family transcriptional regulator [Elioraea sp. Yellowstone]TQF83707.1 TetR/AcrR family transcriptional regulator [Elioraea sp. Yellowstone]
MTTRSVPARKRTNDPEGLRQRLVEAAHVAFQLKGYHGAGIHELKHAAGTTGGALAHHFPTKKALGLAVLRDRVAAAVERAWIAPVRAAPTAAAGIAAAFAGIIAELKRAGEVTGCPLNNLAIELARHDAAFRTEIEAVFLRWRRAIAEKLRQDLEAGLIAGLQPDAFATFVVASYSGAMTMAKVSQSTVPLELCAAELAKILEDARRPAGPPADTAGRGSPQRRPRR